MGRLHLLHAHLPFTGLLNIPTEPYPQRPRAWATATKLVAQVVGDNGAVVEGVIELSIEYHSPAGERQTLTMTQPLRETFVLEHFPELNAWNPPPQGLEGWKLEATLSDFSIYCEPIRTQGTIITQQGIRSLHLIPQALALEIKAILNLDGWVDDPPQYRAASTATTPDGEDKPLPDPAVPERIPSHNPVPEKPHSPFYPGPQTRSLSAGSLPVYKKYFGKPVSSLRVHRG